MKYARCCPALSLRISKETAFPKLLEGKILAMIFAKSSTRTRVSFEVGMTQLGGTPLFLSSSDIQLGRGETIADTARVLSRYVDGIMIRTYKQSDVEELAKHGSVPVINALTDLLHPCQALADMMTIYEAKGDWKGKKLAFLGDGNNMAHSLMIACSKARGWISPSAALKDMSLMRRLRPWQSRMPCLEVHP